MCIEFNLYIINFLFKNTIATNVRTFYRLTHNYMQKIVSITMNVGYRNYIEIKPSFFVSQKQVAADYKPEPLF